MSKPVEAVKVAIRCRPIGSKELSQGFTKIVDVNQETGEVFVSKPGVPGKPKQYTFDYAYGEHSTQQQVYEQCASQIVMSVLEGYNGTVFAYGQTGTGKTWTMDGDRKSKTQKGITSRSFEHVFKAINGSPDKQFLVSVSMLEIYNEEIRDLIKGDQQKLKLKQDEAGVVYVESLSQTEVKSDSDCMKLLDLGSENKQVASTDMNARSSRSHSIFTITVEQSEIDPITGQQEIKKGKLNLVDLAGSERQDKTGATGDRFKEARSINLSLATLGNVIHALVDNNKKHVPYRDSKLTRLLQDSLGGNAKTLMFAAIGPVDYNFDETVNTLRYANRAKNIKNKPKVNQNPKDAKIQEMQDEISLLKNQLMNMMKGNSNVNPQMFVKTGNADQQIAQYDSIEEQLRLEAAKLEEEQERESQRIMAIKNIDHKKREELMKEMKLQQRKEEKIQRQKEELMDKLKSKQERILMGQQKNKEELEQYNKELEQLQSELESKKNRQEEMQKDIADAQIYAEELKDKLSSQKENVILKAQALARLTKLVEQQRDQYEEMCEEQQAQIQDLVIFQFEKKLTFFRVMR